MKAIDSLLDLENFVIVMIKFELISSGDIILNYKVKWTNKTEISMHSSYTTFKFCLFPFSIKLKCPGVGYKTENRKWHNS